MKDSYIELNCFVSQWLQLRHFRLIVPSLLFVSVWSSCQNRVTSFRNSRGEKKMSAMFLFWLSCCICSLVKIKCTLLANSASLCALMTYLNIWSCITSVLLVNCDWWIWGRRTSVWNPLRVKFSFCLEQWYNGNFVCW